jgi:TetR/AcrR family transcriptional regulator
MLERVEASVKQSLRIALMEANQAGHERDQPGPRAGAATAGPLPADYDPAVRANLLASYVMGRWHRYAKSGFTRAPAQHADAHLRLILQ